MMKLSSRPCIQTVLSVLMLLQLAFKVSLQEESAPNEVELLKVKTNELQDRMTDFQRTVFKIFKVLLGPGGEIVGDKLFKTKNLRGTLLDGKNSCDDNLVLPRNVEENKALQKILEQRNEQTILGITYNAAKNIFEDLNGQPLQYFNWAEGQPQILENQKCVIMVPSGEWEISYCDEKWPIICVFYI